MDLLSTAITSGGSLKSTKESVSKKAEKNAAENSTKNNAYLRDFEEAKAYPPKVDMRNQRYLVFYR